MKKKQIIGLSTLLLVLLLGLSTICYARQQTITTDNVNELFNYYNSYWYNNANVNTLKNNVINSLNTYQDTYDNCIFFVYNLSNGRHSMFIYYFNNSNTTLNYYNGTSNWQINSSEIKRFDVIGNSYSTISSVSTTSSNDRGQYFMIRNDLGTLTGPFQSSNIMTFIEPTIPFTFLPKVADTYADVWTYEDVPFYNVSGETLYLGQLLVPNEITINEKFIDVFYYQYGTWNLQEISFNAVYTKVFSNEDGYILYDVFLSPHYFKENYLYHVVWQDKSSEPYATANAIFYIKDVHTVVTNGSLDTALTFSGDYKNAYENEIQNEQDINNIEQAITGTILDDSEVDNILGQFNTSGEIKEIFGYQDIGEKTEGFTVPRMYITYLMQEVLGTLAIDGDQPGNSYIDIPIDGEPNYRVYARYFRTPEDNTLMIFVRHLLVFGGIYCLYRYFVEVAELLTTFNIYDVTNKVDTDQFIYRM